MYERKLLPIPTPFACAGQSWMVGALETFLGKRVTGQSWEEVLAGQVGERNSQFHSLYQRYSDPDAFSALQEPKNLNLGSWLEAR